MGEQELHNLNHKHDLFWCPPKKLTVGSILLAAGDFLVTILLPLYPLPSTPPRIRPSPHAQYLGRPLPFLSARAGKTEKSLSNHQSTFGKLLASHPIPCRSFSCPFCILLSFAGGEFACIGASASFVALALQGCSSSCSLCNPPLRH